MICPVCKASSLPVELQKCPQCESDLGAFALTRHIDKKSKSRLNLIIILSALVLVVVVLWLLTGRAGPGIDNSALEELQAEKEALQSEMEAVKSMNVRLFNENSKLKEAASKKPVKPEKKTREYTVQSGESLYGIARKVYGDGDRYVDLMRDNNITDPAAIKVGQKLIIHD